MDGFLRQSTASQVRTIGPFIVNAVNLVSIAIVVLVRFWLYHSVVFRTSPPKDAAREDADASHGAG